MSLYQDKTNAAEKLIKIWYRLTFNYADILEMIYRCDSNEITFKHTYIGMYSSFNRLVSILQSLVYVKRFDTIIECGFVWATHFKVAPIADND